MRRRMRRAGWVMMGAALGLALVLAALLLYLRLGQEREVRTAIGERLRIPAEALRVERLRADGSARISLRNVGILGEAGDTIAFAPRATLWFNAHSLAGDGPIEFHDVELRQPTARLVQAPDGTWNLFRAFQVTVDGQPIEPDGAGRPLLFRDVRLVDGRLVLALPAERPEAGTFAARFDLPWTTLGGLDHQSYTVTGLNARLPRVLLAGDAGWEVEVGALTGQVQQPDLRIAALQGRFESVGDDGVRFDVATLQVGGSRLAGEGVVRFTEPEILYDVRLRGEPLQLADLRPLLPDLPLEGVARFDLGLVTTAAGRAALAFRALEVDALDSRVAGSLRVAVGGGEPLAFGPTDLRVDPLRLVDLERLGLAQDLPVLGTLTGTVATTAFSPETEEGRLQVNLAADLVPRDDPAGPVSRIVAVGPLAFGGPDRPVIFEGLRIQLQPLQLATLRALAPERAELLRGELRGFVQLGGTTRDLRIASGELVYQVGDAPPSRLTGLSGRIAPDPLSYDLRARAEPLALATLTELFPALPFRAATLSGPLRVTGGAESVAFDANLTGPAGGIRFAGTAQLTDPLRFDVSGQLAAFTAGGVLRGEVPLEGPVSGTFAARGTTEDLRFDVDLTQALGRFVLGGRVRTATDPPLFDVAGRVENFRVGALLGQPGLFPAPMTGEISVSGGAALPYSYAVDLRGNGSVFDLAGIVRPGPVPVYTARGQVLGLQLHRLPYDLPVPVPTVLNASVELDARGTTLETLAGTLWLDARGSLLGGVPVERAGARLAVQGGVLTVDTLAVAMRGNTASASGQWGLTRPAPAPLRFSINAPNLDAIGRAIPTTGLVAPQITGSLAAEGWLAGTAEHPHLAVNARGRRLRFEDLRAGTLALDADLRRAPGIGWSGRAVLDAENAVFFGNQAFQVVRVEASGSGAALAAGVFLRQDANRVLSASGILEMDGVQPRAVALETLNLRLAGASWELVSPTRLRWGGVEGLEIQNLALQRTGEVGGWLQIDGRLPPTGAADLRINARGVDLADARRIWAAAPDVQGRLTLDAVLEGPATAPEMTISGRIDGFRYEGAAADAIVLDAEYLGQRLVGNASVVVNGRPIASVEGAVPILLSYENFIPSFEPLLNEPLVAQVYADSLPLDLVAAFTPGLARGRGVMQSQVTVGGTLEMPTLAGFARLQGGEVTVEELGIRLVDVRVAAVFDRNTIRIDTLQARSGGWVSVGGLVTFEPGAPPRVNLGADLNGFRAVDNREIGRITTSGRIALAGPVTAPVLTGRLSLDDSQIHIPELSDPALDLPLDLTDVGPEPLGPVEVEPPFFADLRIEGLEVTVGDAVWIVSNDMRVQIVGDIVVYRTAADMQVWGSMQTVRGRYTLRIGTINREFDVVSGTVRFMGTPEINPAVDIVAANRVRTATAGPGGDLVILVHVTGTLASPQIALTSDTPVPISESELLSYLIFGRPTFELGDAGGMLAQQILVQEVLGGLVAAELERPFLAAGICDYVRVRPGLATFGGLLRFDALGTTLGGAAIECGRQIAEGLFLTLETGIGGLFGGGQTFDWGVGLEWQINEEWQWELQYGPVRRDLLLLVDPTRRYQLSTDIRRRWEYGGTRRRSILDALPERTILPGEPAPQRLPAPARERDPTVEPAAVVREEEAVEP